MTAQVLSFFQRSPRYAPKPADWTQQELAEFYRVESALIRAGIRVGTDRGMSDENEPWFCFYRSDDGEVVIHFARIDGEYIIAGPAYEEIARGFDFTSLVRNMVARHPLIRRTDSGSNISVHPAALLVAVVGTAFFKTGEARAAESNAGAAQSNHSRPVLLSSSSSAGLTGVAPVNAPLPTYDTAQLPANQAVLILAAALLASDYGVDTTSLDPVAQAAISAAAASLDFGSASASTQAANGDFTLTTASHASATVDNTPAHTVSSVLSLVTLLSTLPQAGDASTAGQALLSAASDSTHHDEALAAPPVSNENGNWALGVRLGLGLGGLPSVEAVQLVRSAAGDAGSQKISVIEVNKLPDILAELINKGEHHTVAQPPITPQPETPNLPTVTDPTPPLGGGALPDPTPDPIQPETPKPPITPTAPVYASPALVKEFIDYFIAHTKGVEVMVKGLDIVMFDTRVLHDVGLIVHLDSVTFDFADGSSISLVGEHSSLHSGILV